MRPICTRSNQTAAILTIAAITAAIEAFNRGDTNVFDALDAIIVAAEAHQALVSPEPRHDAA